MTSNTVAYSKCEYCQKPLLVHSFFIICQHCTSMHLFDPGRIKVWFQHNGQSLVYFKEISANQIRVENVDKEIEILKLSGLIPLHRIINLISFT